MYSSHDEEIIERNSRNHMPRAHVRICLNITRIPISSSDNLCAGSKARKADINIIAKGVNQSTISLSLLGKAKNRK